MAHDLDPLMERYAAAWNDHDLDAILREHTDDTVFQLHNGSPPAKGLAEVRDTFALVLAAYPDLTTTLVRLHLADDHAVVESQMHATTNGERRSIDAVDVISIVDGRIARKDTYLDTAAVASAVAGAR